MSKVIRWQGIAGFVVVMATLVLLVYLFAETIARKAMEHGLESYTGAEVNIDEVNINYSPFIVDVYRIQITDAAKPEQNVVEIAHVNAGVDIWQYLLGKVLVEELRAEQVQFATKRASEGKVYRDPELSITDRLKQQAQNAMAEADISLPDPKALLAGSNLKTIKAANALEQSYQEEKDKLSQLKSQLPSEETIENYQKQVDALSKIKVNSISDINKIKQDFDKLKKQFEQDKAIVLKTKEQLSQTKNIMAKRVNDLKIAPSQDWREIESTYQLDNIDSADFAHILFGEKAREYHDMALTVYQYVKPLLAPSSEQQTLINHAAKGRFVHFDEENAQPDLLIKKAHFSVVTPQGDFDIDLSEVTHQHWLRNVPTQYAIKTNNLLTQGIANLAGQFSLAANNDFETQGNWQMNKLPLPEAALAKTNELSVTLLSGLLAGNGQFKVSNDDLDSINAFTLSQAKYQGSADSSLAKAVLETISSLDTLELGVNATGLLASPNFSIKSPMNQILQKSVMSQVNSKLAGFKSDIQAGLNEKLANGLKLGDSADADILDFENLLNATDGSLSNLLNNDIVKQQEDKLKKKATDKLKGKLGDLFGG
ncbi:TIGR03545 family protein [Thalassotalea sp. LPB0316]|uniref:TIGR03545 family protein n=1 Tax=Thalassotalea sp. LPB0316 TaxID=2769490 RepID=UPI001865F37B|nr:TIGR03545 family protein [Thalassotalea sp. LPB0316]QOL27042.1 TIGR03545 family protein [Thalassotalea sp. LPB0316]